MADAVCVFVFYAAFIGSLLVLHKCNRLALAEYGELHR